MEIQKMLGINTDELLRTNLHFAIGITNTLEPLHYFYRDEFQEWQENQNPRYFKRDFILSLIHFKDDEWLFAGFYKNINPDNSEAYFKTVLLDKALHLIGRLVVKHSKSHKRHITNLENSIHNLELSEILKVKRTVEPFTGFKNVKLNFNLLQSIVLKREPSWKEAFENAKGVYLITDLMTGRLYVGSAFGSMTLWHRMVEYAKTGHGNDKILKKLLQFHGDDYKSNLQLTILEAKETYEENNEIIAREAFWKEILATREFGYNMS